MDGTLIPVQDWKIGASSRNYRFSANVQVVIDADMKMVVAAARPVPGNTADGKAWRDAGPAGVITSVTVLADGASINEASLSTRGAAHSSPGTEAAGPCAAGITR